MSCLKALRAVQARYIPILCFVSLLGLSLRAYAGQEDGVAPVEAESNFQVLLDRAKSKIQRELEQADFGKVVSPEATAFKVFRKAKTPSEIQQSIELIRSVPQRHPVLALPSYLDYQPQDQLAVEIDDFISNAHPTDLHNSYLEINKFSFLIEELLREPGSSNFLTRIVDRAPFWVDALSRFSRNQGWIGRRIPSWLSSNNASLNRLKTALTRIVGQGESQRLSNARVAHLLSEHDHWRKQLDLQARLFQPHLSVAGFREAVREGADLSGWRLIDYAIAKWSQDTLEELYRHILAHPIQGVSPLVVAAGIGDVSKLRELHEGKSQIDINSGNSDGTTALIMAARTTRGDAIEYLLNHGAKRETFNKEGESALGIGLELAVFQDPRVVNWLLDPKLPRFNIDETAPDGRTLLDYAIMSSEQTRFLKTKLVLDLGANPNRPSPISGMTPLVRAIRVRDSRLTQLLLEKRSDPNQPSTSPPLSWAITSTSGPLQTGDLIFEQLIDAGANPEQLISLGDGKDGDVPVFALVLRNMLRICQTELRYVNRDILKSSVKKLSLMLDRTDHPEQKWSEQSPVIDWMLQTIGIVDEATSKGLIEEVTGKRVIEQLADRILRSPHFFAKMGSSLIGPTAYLDQKLRAGQLQGYMSSDLVNEMKIKFANRLFELGSPGNYNRPISAEAQRVEDFDAIGRIYKEKGFHKEVGHSEAPHSFKPIELHQPDPLVESRLLSENVPPQSRERELDLDSNQRAMALKVSLDFYQQLLKTPIMRSMANSALLNIAVFHPEIYKNSVSPQRDPLFYFNGSNKSEGDKEALDVWLKRKMDLVHTCAPRALLVDADAEKTISNLVGELVKIKPSGRRNSF